MAGSTIDLGVISATVSLATGALEEQAGAVEAALSALQETLGGIEESFGGLDEVLAGIAEALGGLDETVSTAAESFSALDESLSSADAALGTLAESADTGAAALDTLDSAVGGNSAALDENAAAADTNTTAHEDNAAAASASVGSFALLGVALGVAGGKFLDMGMQAQDSLSVVNALTGSSAQQMQQYTAGAEQLASQLGVTMKQAGDGLYYVASAGFTGADALTVLKPAMEEAKAGGVDLSVTADALTSAMNSYGAKADEATHYSDIMLQAVSQGKQTFQDFASAIGMAAVTGHSAGFSFQEVAAGEATMTQSGVSAHRAVMELDTLMRAIGLSADVVAQKAKKMGIEGFDTAKFASMSLIDKLQYLQEVTHGNNAELMKLTGGAAGFSAAEILLAQNGKAYNSVLDKMQHSQGATQEAFDKSEQTISAALDHIKANLSILAYQVVATYGPSISEALNKVSDALGWIASFITNHVAEATPILASFAAVLGGTLVSSILAVVDVGKIVAAVFSPWALALGLVAGALAVLIPYLQHLYKTSEPFRLEVQALSNELHYAGQMVSYIAGVIARDFAPVLGQIVDTLQGAAGQAFAQLLPLLDQAGVALGTVLYGAAVKLGPLLQQVAQWVSAHLVPAIGQLVAWLAKLALHEIVTAFGDVAAVLGTVAGVVARLLPHVAAFASVVAQTLWPALQTVVPVLVHLANVLAGALVRALQVILPIVGQLAGALLDGLGAAIQAVAGFIRDDAAPAVEGLATWLGTHLGPVIQQIAAWVQTTLLPALERFGEWVSTTALPALAAFASALGDKLGPIVQQLATWFQTTLLPVLQRVGTWIVDTALPAIAQFASWLGEHLGPIVQQLGNWFATSLLPVVERFGTFLVQQVIPAVIGVAQHIGQFADDVITRVVPIIQELAGIVSFFANILLTVLKPVAIVVFGAVILALNVLKGIWDAVWPGLQQTLFGVWEMIKGIVEIGWSIISGIIKIGLDLLGGQWGKAWDDIKTMLGGVWDGITKVLGGAWDTIKGIFTSQIDLLKGIAGKIWDGIKGVFAAGINATLDLLAGFVNGFADAVDGIAHALGVKGNPIPEWHPSHVSFGSSSGGGGSPSGGSASGGGSAHGQHAAYAKGTDFHPGGVALVGEEGPELVNLPRGAAVLPAGPTAALMGAYAGGIGDFFGGLADKVKSALGDVAGLVSDAPGALLDKALSAAGLNLSSLSGALGQMGGGLLTTLKTEVLPAITKWLASLISTSDSGGGPVSASYGNAPGLLPGFPLMNQLAQKDINDQNDCVPTSLASGVSYLLHHLVSPVGLKDEVYGASYMGGQSPARYIPAAQKLGVQLQRATGSAAQLISDIVGHLRMGQPVLGSIPSNWNVISHGGSTHEVAFAGYDPKQGLLTAMNPWRGFFQTAPASWWEPRLQYGEVDPLIRMAHGGVLREMVMGRGVSSGRGYLLGERGPETVTPGDARSPGGDTHLHLTVQVTTSPHDGSPAEAGQTFGRELASSLALAMSQRGH